MNLKEEDTFKEITLIRIKNKCKGMLKVIFVKVCMFCQLSHHDPSEYDRYGSEFLIV